MAGFRRYDSGERNSNDLVGMGQIFISAGHGGYEDGVFDLGTVLPNTTEAAEMIQVRDLVVAELRSRGFAVLAVPDDLSPHQAIHWINARCRLEDVAVEIHAGAIGDQAVRGATVFHIAQNDIRLTQAELVLLALLRRVPQLPSRGVRADTESPLGRIPFCRDVNCPSLMSELGYLSNPEDLALLQNQRRDVALGIADGLASWSRAVEDGHETDEDPVTFAEVNILVNDGPYEETGIVISDNIYVPIDLVEQLGLNLEEATDLRRLRYASVVYVKAIELRHYDIAVSWDADNRAVVLRSRTTLGVCPGFIDRIMGKGMTSDVQLLMFLKGVNEAAVSEFPELAKLYREEAATEGVNHDIAFCQMLVETNALTFNNGLTAEQNNFGGIGVPMGGGEEATFPSARIGVRAQIQHLKAYGSTEPLVLRRVDPRFQFVRRGVAPLVHQLAGRWSADPHYGDRILALVRRLYESAGLL
jgi:N-acetylmuramoyl-L-alanine amidase